MNLKIKMNDMYGEKIEKIVKSELKIMKNGKVYSYFDENTLNIIYVYFNKIMIKRKGDIESSQTFKLKEDTFFKYSTNFLTSDFKISTSKLEIYNNKFLLNYSIFQKDSIFNKISLSVEEV